MPPKKTTRRPAKKKTIQERQRRVSMGGLKLKLDVDPDLIPKGFRPRWINDLPGRLIRAKQAGYVFAERKDVPQVGDADASQTEGVDSRVRVYAGTNSSGEPLYAYLMLQKESWYKEDQIAKEENLQELEEAIRQGADERGRPGDGVRYVPKDSPISINHGN